LPEHFGNCAAFVGINSLTSRATLAIGETSRLDAIQRRVRMYKAVTRGIEVTAEPFYLEDQSEPDDNRYVWGYRITIANNSSQTVQLRSRYWQITDGNGHIEEVQGAGVIGEQPTLNPGDSYQYSSGCPLSTTSGVMVGRYQMQASDGNAFEVDIPAFSLDIPEARRTLN